MTVFYRNSFKYNGNYVAYIRLLLEVLNISVS